MAIRQILKDGDETLRKKSRPVDRFDSRLHELLDDMADTMYENNGIGLAAPQVGILRRIFVIDLNDETGLKEFINPEIVEPSGCQTATECCLSVPDTWGEVDRPATLKIKAQDRHGKLFELEAEEILAVCICHEYDHLDGILFKDKVKGELQHS
ncbi:MAG: peptide deformylase [Oscillospiraceae bacterium]|nr:peptide deformylase [Oscillospiraceae bacterium]